MIYSPKFNFVAIRTPKSGSTTMAMYFFDSGLLNINSDILSMPGIHSSFITKEGGLNLDSIDPTQKLVEYTNPDAYQSHAEKQLELQKLIGRGSNTNLRTMRRQLNRFMNGESREQSLLTSEHKTYSTAVERGEIPKDTPCYSTIRNPIDRWLSTVNVTYSIKEIEAEGINELSLRLLESMTAFKEQHKTGKVKPTELPDGVTTFLYNPQHSYLSETPTLWPLERLHECMVDFIIPKGGRVRGDWKVRANITRDRSAQLTPEVTQKINAYFEKDLTLWEAVI